MTTPAHAFGEGGERTHTAIMNGLPSPEPARLDAVEGKLADHDAALQNLHGRVSALESPAAEEES